MTDADKIQKIIKEVIKALQGLRPDLSNEKRTQSQIFEAIQSIGFTREYRLDKKNIPDFFLDGIAVEVKIKGQKKDIYRQLQRYCSFEDVKTIVLITARSMGLPSEIENKPCYYINLSRAFL